MPDDILITTITGVLHKLEQEGATRMQILGALQILLNIGSTDLSKD